MVFYSTFEEQVNRNHYLYKMANQINWEAFGESFAKYVIMIPGKPAKPIRLMVSLLILRKIRNLSSEEVVEQWTENFYFQYFSGKLRICSYYPCLPEELDDFRRSIGEDGEEKIITETYRAGKAITTDDSLIGNTKIHTAYINLM